MPIRKLIFLCFVCLGAAAVAQIDLARQAAVDAGSFRGRTYSNKALGFSCEIPKGWTSFSELLDKSTGPKVAIEHERSLLRSQGVLLAAIEQSESLRNVPVIIVTSPPGIQFVDSVKREDSLAIVAEPRLPGAPPEDLFAALRTELDRQKALDPAINPALPEELMIDSQKLIRTTFFSPKNNRYTSLAVAARREYAMKFFFRSNSEKNLHKLMKVMETMHFDSGSSK